MNEIRDRSQAEIRNIHIFNKQLKRSIKSSLISVDSFDHASDTDNNAVDMPPGNSKKKSFFDFIKFSKNNPNSVIRNIRNVIFLNIFIIFTKKYNYLKNKGTHIILTAISV